MNFNEERKKYEAPAVSFANAEDIVRTSGGEDMGEWDQASYSSRRSTQSGGYKL